ncbi:angiopoietin-2-like [Mytilus californianus]|uniref:angiopoietin-2-like n=1 Tax=Mytilus californianus TaxID=6549 RepID=UPI0022457694|nr:angiopoietin-2-like [Mytilus californianus]
MKLFIGFISIIIGPLEVNSIRAKDDYIKRELQEYPVQINDILHYIQGKCHRTHRETVEEMQQKKQLIIKKLATYKEVIKLNKHIEKEFKWITEELKDHKEAPEIITSLRKDVQDICEGPPLNQQRECTDLKKLNKKTGIHTIYPDNVHGIKVYCNMEVDGGGWSVIQRRQDGTTNFYRSWSDYEKGFGSPERNVWLGNYTYLIHFHFRNTKAYCLSF